MSALLKTLRLFCCLLAFGLGLAATSLGLARVTPLKHGSNLDAKLNHWRANKDTYDAVYVGSSMVNHHFIPADFDAAMAQAGHPIRSFNLGMDGMWPPESFFILQEILEEKPAKLRWVFFELMNFKPILEGNEETLRTVSWHDWRHTMMITRHIFTVPLPGQRTLGEKLNLASLHWRLFTRQLMRVGAGQDWLRVRFKLDRVKKPKPLEDDGYEAGGESGLPEKDRARFAEVVAKLRLATATPIQPVLRDALNRAAVEIQKAGAEPVFVLSPSIYPAERFTDWPPAGLTFFNFSQPDYYPALYEMGNRYDTDHLNPNGAREFTRSFAEEFARKLNRK